MTYHEGKIGKVRRLPVLVDVDGVCADFVGKVSRYIEDKFDISIDRSKIYSDVRDQANGLWDDSCEDYIKSAGFALSLDELPGSVEAIKTIMENYDVMFVTSPYESSKTWCYDRFEWLKMKFDISRDDIIFARDKRFVKGITLIDDRFENVIDWAHENQWDQYFGKKYPVLKTTSQNKKDLEKADYYRASGEGYHYFDYRNDILGLDSTVSVYVGKDWDSILRFLRIEK